MIKFLDDKSTRLIGVLILLSIGLFLILEGSRALVRKRPILVGGKQVVVDMATTDEQWQRGLSGRKVLCGDCGMLFVMEKRDIYSFWMRRMYFDIDIVWIDGDTVVDISAGAKKPAISDFEAPRQTYQSREQVDRVLEVNAGWVTKKGIKIGDKIVW